MHSSELYSIGEFSKMCHVSVKTLRHYDSIGLLPSYKKNPETNYRYYTYDQMYQLFFIQNMKNFDFSLKEIQEMLGQNDRRRLIRKLEGRIDEFSKKITRMEMQRDFLSSFLERIKSGDSLMEARTSLDQEDLSLMVERIPVSNVIFLHQHKTNYINHEINFAARRDLVQIAKKNSLLPSGPFTATYHNPPLEQFFPTPATMRSARPSSGLQTPPSASSPADTRLCPPCTWADLRTSSRPTSKCCAGSRKITTTCPETFRRRS